MVGFQVGPEHAEFAGQLLQAAVVDRWLAFSQIVDEQVTDGLAGELMPVDHFLRRALARGARSWRNRSGAAGPKIRIWRSSR